LPKAELHLHIEGTLEPDMVFALAERNGVTLPWPSVEVLTELRNFTNLQSFLDLYYQAMVVLRTREDFFDLACAYLERAHADGVRHAEIFFDPQVHLDNGVPFADVLGGLRDALTAAESAHGITGGLIMCVLRDRGPEAAAHMLQLAEPYADQLLGLGMDSSEIGFPPEPFAAVFARAAELGLRRVAHVGEEGPPEYIWGALNTLGIERVDHGVRCIEDPMLTTYLAEHHIPLTVCPLSNVRLKGVPTMADHPLARLLDLGLAVTVNSDDPAYFGGYLSANFTGAVDALSLTDAQVVKLCRNSIEASFASPARQAELLSCLPA
jgi:adenosine deaminase